MEQNRQADARLIEALERGDAEDFFRILQIDGDRQKVCGLPPIYTMMHAMGAPVRGKLLRYDINVEEPTDSLVSFMSLAFYADAAGA